jgi:hypothetical protein
MPPPGGGGPPGGMLNGPPPPPPGSPSLAGIPPAPGAGPGAGPPGPNQAGALPKLVFELENSLKVLARALPGDAGEQIDSIIQQIRNIVAQALQGGGGSSGGGPDKGAPPSSTY